MSPFDEIGSEYWKVDTDNKIENIINNAVFTASGRSAHSLIIESADIKNRRALLPAYTCQHIVEPFAWTGWEVGYYGIHNDLTIELDSLKLGIEKAPGCIIVQSYYGFHTTKQANPLFKQAQAAGIIIIEDITHSFLSGWSPSYKKADYQFCSLRKWTGLTDGGYALSLYKNKLKKPLAKMESFVSHRSNAQVMKRKYITEGDPKYKEEFLKLFKQAEDLLDGDIAVYSMSEAAKTAFSHIDFDYIKNKRQENYNYLQRNIASDYVKPLFGELADETCPIMFPVYIERGRSELRQRLIDNRIYCPIHWPAPIQLTPEAKANSRAIYNNIMSLPCDQRYGIEDMQRLVDIVNTFSIE